MENSKWAKMRVLDEDGNKVVGSAVNTIALRESVETHLDRIRDGGKIVIENVRCLVERRRASG